MNRQELILHHKGSTQRRQVPIQHLEVQAHPEVQVHPQDLQAEAEAAQTEGDS